MCWVGRTQGSWLCTSILHAPSTLQQQQAPIPLPPSPPHHARIRAEPHAGGAAARVDGAEEGSMHGAQVGGGPAHMGTAGQLRS